LWVRVSANRRFACPGEPVIGRFDLMLMLKRTSWSVLALLLVPVIAAAQNAPAPPPLPANPPSAPPITAGWQDGFVLQTGNGDFRLQLGLSVQMDGRFVLDDTPAVINTFTLRKLRPTLSGRVGK
jgi:hypothetical protein